MNTKNKIKKLLKLGILCFGISLLLFSCEKEIEQPQSAPSTTYKLQLEEDFNLSDEREIINQLRIPLHKTFRGNSFAKKSNENNLADFRISISSVSKIQTETYKAYTFSVISSSDKFDLQNFVAIKNNDGTVNYLLVNYMKAKTKNSNFPYIIQYKKLDSNLNLIDATYLSKAPPNDAENNIDKDRECYRIVFFPCGCGGKADGHKTSGASCCKGSPGVLKQINCDEASGNGHTPDFEEPPCLECAVDPNGNAPGASSTSDPSTSGNSGGSTSTPKQYTYEGEVTCDANGACKAPLFIPLKSVQSFEQKLSLSSLEIKFINGLEGNTLKKELEEFLEKNKDSEKAEIFVKEAIQALIKNKGLTFEKFSENNIITIDLQSSPTVIDIKEELKHFDKSKPAKLTIYVEQAVENSREVTASLGHTFIGIKQDDVVRNLGFYPDNGGLANLLGNQDSEIHDNSGSPYHVSITIDVSSSQLSNVINYIEKYPKKYDINKYNCTDFGIEVASLGNINLPKTVGKKGILFKGRNPGDLGEDIRTFSLPSGAIRNLTGGNAPKRFPN